MIKNNAKLSSIENNNILPPFLIRRIAEGIFILVLTVAALVLLSLWNYHGYISIYSHANSAGGIVGAYIAYKLYFSLGYFAYILPLCTIYVAAMALKNYHTLYLTNQTMLLLRAIGLILMLIGGCALLDLSMQITSTYNIGGGIVGSTVVHILNKALGMPGTILSVSAMFLVGLTWLTGISWIYLIELIGYSTLSIIRLSIRAIKACANWIRSQCTYRVKKPGSLTHKPEIIQVKKLAKLEVYTQVSTLAAKPHPEKSLSPSPLQNSAQPKTAIIKATVIGQLPGLNLLNKNKAADILSSYSAQELESMSRDVEQHLLDFGIQADVVEVHPGPVITRFELQLAAGVKVSKLSALAKDLARSLSVTSVRVVEIIPGKTLVGIELPNQSRIMVSLAEVLSAKVYEQAQSPLTLALGVDIAGHPMVVDLAKMPHLLVAGTTGSGKSVGINAMILSLLFKATPEQVRIIMVDPKMLELSVYDGIPHLLTPVVTDMKEAASALRWCVEEMERRYRLMATLGVRNLAGFNTKVIEAQVLGEPLKDPFYKNHDNIPEFLSPLPYIVVVIDELADMMMVVGKKVEQLIARIAQKARASGIHLILATQRPSVDVLTGLIKSNIPTRISFQVSSTIDSRTIIDQKGAEQLLGNGDMLFVAPGTGAPLRVHGAFVDDKEVHRIADDWRARGVPQYIDAITKQLDNPDLNEDTQPQEDIDPLYNQAVEFVVQTRKASISSVQRRLKIGYNRAARLIEEMESTGIIGPLDGGFRDVLIAATPQD